eukprot:CAMPEP_0171318814 /NCGR_PEP_ID=MMETSP0816-20121228/91615_1 /TAXON_ID=420281 /ORGANISM="Proboscia inermis, Strain CCAP1064/1" /LENGTH=84 /DNA_ID=CAMNT_0011813771 /DNA_START=56 /DNA_END=307 /DNA_ORIENTATION=+
MSGLSEESGSANSVFVPGYCSGKVWELKRFMPMGSSSGLPKKKEKIFSIGSSSTAFAFASFSFASAGGSTSFFLSKLKKSPSIN